MKKRGGYKKDLSSSLRKSKKGLIAGTYLSEGEYRSGGKINAPCNPSMRRPSTAYYLIPLDTTPVTCYASQSLTDEELEARIAELAVRAAAKEPLFKDRGSKS